MTAKKTAAQKAEAKAKKDAAVDGDISLVEGTPHIVEFDHTFDDSEPIMKPNSNGVMQYTGHDKQVKTTVHHIREYPNKQLAEAFEENHKNFPEHGVSNVKISEKK